MKRIGYVYQQMLDKELITECIKNAAKDKKDKRETAPILANIDVYVDKIYDMLKDKCVEFSPYHIFQNYDPHSKKTRNIYRPNFYPDQIIHWCMITVLKPMFMKGMYKYCCGSIPGRGAKYGCRCVRTWLTTDPDNTQYVAKLDITKFYESIDISVLYTMFESKIKDASMLELLAKLIRTMPIGVPIGNYTSQWFANFYLQGLDHYIKETLHVAHYVRYVDDLILFGATSFEMHEAVRSVQDYTANKLHVTIKKNWQVFPLEPRGLDFLGFVFHRNTTYVRDRNFLSFTRQARLLRARLDQDCPVSLHEAMSMMSRLAFVQRVGNRNIVNKYLPPEYQVQLIHIISKNMKRRHQDAIRRTEQIKLCSGSSLEPRPAIP